MMLLTKLVGYNKYITWFLGNHRIKNRIGAKRNKRCLCSAYVGSQTYFACVSLLLRAAASRKNTALLAVCMNHSLWTTAPGSSVSYIYTANGIHPAIFSEWGKSLKFTLLCTAQQLPQVWFGTPWCLSVSKTSFSFLLCCIWSGWNKLWHKLLLVRLPFI